MHVPDDWTFRKAFEEKVAKHYRGREGPYLRDLVERDLQGMSIGAPDSAFTIADIHQWMAAESTLLRAARIAVNVLHAPTQPARQEAARELAQLIVSKSLRPDPAEHSPLAAESAARYIAVSTEGVQLERRPKRRVSSSSQ
jgi:NADPH:quinone reductase-like Zn-dependent oxidoreductase